jgi:hypothetical protein
MLPSSFQFSMESVTRSISPHPVVANSDGNYLLRSVVLRMRAKRRIGELSAGLETAIGTHLPNVPALGRLSKTQTLAAAGISKTEARTYFPNIHVPETLLQSRAAPAIAFVIDG